jgi:hypothetical protein
MNPGRLVMFLSPAGSWKTWATLKFCMDRKPCGEALECKRTGPPFKEHVHQDKGTLDDFALVRLSWPLPREMGDRRSGFAWTKWNKTLPSREDVFMLHGNTTPLSATSVEQPQKLAWTDRPRCFLPRRRCAVVMHIRSVPWWWAASSTYLYD